LKKLNETVKNTSLFDRDIHCLLGLPFDAVDERSALRVLQDSIALHKRCFLSTPNLNWIVACLQDRELRQSVINSDLSVADGMPIIWVAKLLRIPLRQRVPGSGLLETLRQDRANPVSVYFFGGPEGVAERACNQLNSELGAMRCAGFECPGFGNVESMSSAQTIAKINASHADFLVVSLGAKKGQAWIERNRQAIIIPVISHLGAVVNFIAGTVARAPLWMQRTGLEWVWRIQQEPGLWRRYFSDGLTFLRLLATRVLPLALYVRINRPASIAEDAPAFECQTDNNSIKVILSGNWIGADLGELRGCFRSICQLKLNTQLHMHQITHVDSAFIGLLILLSGECRRQSIPMNATGTNRTVTRLLHYFCADYLLK
jgi:N-acetylglucosaminyldiphosphoundecaprenol N-acetyl-beta-D-mannosaminyltransferase